MPTKNQMYGHVPALFAAVFMLATPATQAREVASEIQVDEAGMMTDVTVGKVKYGSLGIGIGTGGIGIDFAHPLNKYFDVRLGYDFGKFSFDFEEDADDVNAEPIEYEADLKFSSARLLIDYKPFGGRFRISAGYYTGTPELDGLADGFQEEVELGDGVFNIDGQIRANARIGGGAPYIGIGWGGTTEKRGFGISNDIGVLLAKAPKFSVAVTGRACEAFSNPECDPNGVDGFDAGTDPAFQSEVERERANLEEDSKDFDIWPILRFSIHYRF